MEVYDCPICQDRGYTSPRLHPSYPYEIRPFCDCPIGVALKAEMGIDGPFYTRLVNTHPSNFYD